MLRQSGLRYIFRNIVLDEIRYILVEKNSESESERERYLKRERKRFEVLARIAIGHRKIHDETSPLFIVVQKEQSIAQKPCAIAPSNLYRCAESNACDSGSFYSHSANGAYKKITDYCVYLKAVSLHHS